MLAGKIWPGVHCYKGPVCHIENTVHRPLGQITQIYLKQLLDS